MKIFKDEPILDKNDFFVYVPVEPEQPATFSYNGIVLPPLPHSPLARALP